MKGIVKSTVLFFVMSSVNAFAIPKYGPQATLLSKSHEYIHEQKAPDYWALSSYYLPQQNRKSCSLASVVMLVNAARGNLDLAADDKLVTQTGLLKKVNDQKWSDAVDMRLPGGGVALDDLKGIIEESLRAYGFKSFSVEVFHMDNTKIAKRILHKHLLENEQSSRDFILSNFNQGIMTGDPEGGGHISPVGGYDSKRRRVLIMDVDRLWYEPYWVSEETFAESMATIDHSLNLSRGYIYIKLNEKFSF